MVNKNRAAAELVEWFKAARNLKNVKGLKGRLNLS